MSPSANTQAPPQAGPATLAGQSAQASAPAPTSGGGDQGMQMMIEKVRGMESDLLAIGQQFPAAGPAAEQAVQSVRAVLRQIIANPGAPEPSAPNIGG